MLDVRRVVAGERPNVCSFILHPYVVLSNSHIILYYQFCSIKLLVEIRIQYVKRALFNCLFFIYNQLQFDFHYFIRFQGFPYRFYFVDLVTLVVIHELLKKDEHYSCFYAARVFVAFFKML